MGQWGSWVALSDTKHSAMPSQEQLKVCQNERCYREAPRSNTCCWPLGNIFLCGNFRQFWSAVFLSLRFFRTKAFLQKFNRHPVLCFNESWFATQVHRPQGFKQSGPRVYKIVLMFLGNIGPFWAHSRSFGRKFISCHKNTFFMQFFLFFFLGGG